jgi:hypothetical protein
MKTKKQYRYIHNFSIELESDIFDSELCDTSVKINNQTLFVISGNEIDLFVNELKTLINKYAI